MNIQTEYPAAALLQAAGIAITGIHGELAQERWRRTCAALAGTSSENALLDQIGREYGLDFCRCERACSGSTAMYIWHATTTTCGNASACEMVC